MAEAAVFDPIAIEGAPAEAQIAWLAGLFDGEGSFGIVHNKKGADPRALNSLVQMSMTHEVTIQRAISVMRALGITAVGYTYQERDPARHLDAHYIRVTRKADQRLLCATLLPHLVTKRRHAQLLHEYTDSRIGLTPVQDGKITGRRRPLTTDREWEIYEELRTLNFRGPAAIQAGRRSAMLARNPVSHVQWVPREWIRSNTWNPNTVPRNELNLLKVSILADGMTQPVVTMRDPVDDPSGHPRFVVVDGFHRWTVCGDPDVIRERTLGYVPIVVIAGSVDHLMASTVRHNRARGKHSVAGMSSLVLQMLDAGLDDAHVMSELGLTHDELTRLKYVSGFAKLFESAEYHRAWQTRRQIGLRTQYAREHPDEEVPEI